MMHCLENNSENRVLKENIEFPKYPIPPLKSTLEKFLLSLKPLVTEEQYNKTKENVLKFEIGIGPKLQKLLELRASLIPNWIADWWVESAYFENQLPLVFYSSPGVVFPIQNYEKPNDQLRMAAKLIYATLEFKSNIDNSLLQNDMIKFYYNNKQYPLDMSQYLKFFGTNRRPGTKHDTLSFSHSNHIIVAYNNRFYKVLVYNEEGKYSSVTEIYAQLKIIVMSKKNIGLPIGILTTESRNNWAKVYKELNSCPANAVALKEIESSLFLVAIDQPNCIDNFAMRENYQNNYENINKSKRQTIAAHQMLHGNKINSGNRWFDKSIQLIVGKDGESGLCYEHSPTEGSPIAKLMDYIIANLDKIENLLKSHENLNQQLNTLPEEILFKINEEIYKNIIDARLHLNSLIDNINISCCTFLKFGKDIIKSCNLSPDSFIQIAIQTAFYRIHQLPGAQYESATTRMYLFGRTETIRSCSMESLQFAKQCFNDQITSEEKFSLMKNAIEVHKKYAVEAVKGLGIDRHFLGLQKIAIENGIEIPEIFNDFGFQHSKKFKISSSQVLSNNEAFMCYGPLVEDGYSCCYNPQPNQINFAIATYNSCRYSRANEFKIILQQTLIKMENILRVHMKKQTLST